jgi:CBS domain-containing protein
VACASLDEGGPTMQVRNVLHEKSRKLVTIRLDDTVRSAISLFVSHNIGSLPVVDDTGRLVGIFTERDVLFKVHADPERFADRRMSEVMTPDPVTCTPDDIVHDVMGAVSQYQIGQLPVVCDAKLVGVVSVGDLVRALHEKVESENRHLMSYIYGSNG